MIQRFLPGLFALLSVLLGTVAGAQALTVTPWPAANGRTTLSGSGFKPGATVTLRFSAPKPTLSSAKPVPGTVQANPQGSFKLELRVPEGNLKLTAQAGTQTAALEKTAAPPSASLEYVIDGTTVIARANGRVASRSYLSGPVKTLERSLGGYRATVKTPAGLEQIFNLENGKVLERVTYPPSPALLATLTRPTYLKERVTDPVRYWQEKSQSDPTNPFLRLEWGAAAQRFGDANAVSILRGVLDVKAPFYVFVRLAARLEGLKQPELAQGALERAKREFAAAGYDPGFAVSKEALAAWGDPLGEARRLFAGQNPVRAGAWLELLRSTTPRFPGYGVVYAEYASFLRAQNRSSEAADWVKLSAELDAGTTFTLGDQSYTRLSALSLGGLIVLLLSFLALQFVLLLKYLPQQTRDLAPFGGRSGALSKVPLLRLRLSLPGYQTITEKLIGVLLLGGAVLLLGLWQYSSHAARFLETPALAQGTAGGADYYQALGAVTAPGSAYLTGLGAQLDGDAGKALESYRAAPGIAAANNNAGTILAARGDTPGATAAYTLAANLDGSSVAARVNLGNAADSFRAVFHNALRKNLPMLELPTPRQLVEFRLGAPEQEFVRIVTDPWTYLTGLPLNLPEWVMGLIAAVALAVVAGALLWLFVPRIRTAATAPRSFLYHLFALLVPGSGLADEVWGVLLLLPTGVIATLLFRHFYATERLEALFEKQQILGIGTSGAWYDIGANLQLIVAALIGIYIVNALGWLLETVAVNRRRRRAAIAAANPPVNSPKTP